MIAYIFSGPNLLRERLVKELTDRGLKVKINEDVTENPAYLFLIQGIHPADSFFSKPQIKKILEVSNKYLPKTQVILPYQVNDNYRKKVEWIAEASRKIPNRNLRIVYLGEIFGVGMQIGGSYIADAFDAIWKEKTVKVPETDFDLYTLSINDAISQLIKGIFSYGFPKKEIVVANKTTAWQFGNQIKEDLPDTNFETQKSIRPLSTISNFDLVTLSFDKKILKETLDWLVKHRKVTEKILAIKPKIKIKAKVKIKLPKFKKIKVIAISLIIIFWILALPLMAFLASSITLKKGYESIKENKFQQAGTYLNISRICDSVATFVFGRVNFETGLRASLLVDEMDGAGIKMTQLIPNAITLENNLTNSATFDLNSIAQKIYLNLDSLYTELSYFEADFNNMPQVKSFLPDLNMGAIRNYVGNLKLVAQDLPYILGQNKTMNYLLLVQDNSELWPTGGKISKLGIVTIDKGKITDSSFFDTGTSDNQLKGSVAPPDALRKYLGVSNWTIANSNWDPDFRVSATQAEWFIGKEMNVNIDGVIGISSETFQKMTAEGLSTYVKNDILSDLNAKNIQIYVNDDTNVTMALFNLNWDGEVNTRAFGIVEANLGGNKINIDIERSATITPSAYSVKYVNKSPYLPYRVYVRLVAPPKTIFGQVTENINGQEQVLQANITETDSRKDEGVLMQIPPEQSVTLIFFWTQNINNSIYVRKQAGVISFPTNIVFSDGTSYNTNLTSDYGKN